MKDGKVVKGVNFVDLNDIGDPIERAKLYEQGGAEEIAFLDITATVEGRDSVFETIERAAKAVKIPITFGGGIRDAADFGRMLKAGASKVSINSAAVARPELITEVSEKFGKEHVVVAVDGKRVGDEWHVVVRGGMTDAGLDVVEWSKKCEALGAGEILFTTVDGDGAQTGYEIEITKAVVDAVKIPVVASGGCGTVADMVKVIKETDCAAVLAASLFHYDKATVNEVKEELKRNGIEC